MRTEHTQRDHAVTTSHRPAGDVAPPGARVAGILLVVVGLANVAAGAWGLAVGADQIAPAIAVGLALAGAATVVLGRLVRRGNHVAIHVALVVFELLLVPRLMTLGEPGAGAWASLVLLVALVALLWVAAAQVRRRRATARSAPTP